jgi:hypothetical protein
LIGRRCTYQKIMDLSYSRLLASVGIGESPIYLSMCLYDGFQWKVVLSISRDSPPNYGLYLIQLAQYSFSRSVGLIVFTFTRQSIIMVVPQLHQNSHFQSMARMPRESYHRTQTIFSLYSFSDLDQNVLNLFCPWYWCNNNTDLVTLQTRSFRLFINNRHFTNSTRLALPMPHLLSKTYDSNPCDLIHMIELVQTILQTDAKTGIPLCTHCPAHAADSPFSKLRTNS